MYVCLSDELFPELYDNSQARDRFESTASAGRRTPSVSPIDLPLPIPEDPLPFSAKGDGRQ